jgi:hypothetical protein
MWNQIIISLGLEFRLKFQILESSLSKKVGKYNQEEMTLLEMSIKQIM